MERREFLKISGTTAMAIAVAPSMITQTLRAEDGTLYVPYEKVQLKDASGNPLKASTLKVEENYIFHYPHVATPALLVDLGEATSKDVKLKADDGTEYIYKGGSGKGKSIVAYSAICPHQLTHPKKDTTFLQYVPKSGSTASHSEGGVFVCSSHLSAFSSKDGGKRLSGPATEGLPAVILEVAADDTIWAVGVLGPDKFQNFFKSFKGDLKAEYGRNGAKKLVKTEAKVMVLSNFSADLQQY